MTLLDLGIASLMIVTMRSRILVNPLSACGDYGVDKRVPPLLAKDLPGLIFDVREQRVSEEEAYKFC